MDETAACRIRYDLAPLLSPVSADLDPFLPELSDRFPNISDPGYVTEHFAGGTVEWCETPAAAVVLAGAHRAAGHLAFIALDSDNLAGSECVFTSQHPAPQLVTSLLDHLSIVVAELAYLINWGGHMYLELDDLDVTMTTGIGCDTYIAAMLVASVETELGHSTLIGHDPDSGEYLVYSTRPDPDWASDHRCVPVRPHPSMLLDLWHIRHSVHPDISNAIEPLLDEDGHLADWTGGSIYYCGDDPAGAFLWALHENSDGQTATVMFDHDHHEYVTVSTRPMNTGSGRDPYHCRRHPRPARIRPLAA